MTTEVEELRKHAASFRAMGRATSAAGLIISREADTIEKLQQENAELNRLNAAINETATGNQLIMDAAVERLEQKVAELEKRLLQVSIYGKYD